MTTNSFLVRWNGGWTERTASPSVTAVGRMEALLGLGADASIAEVNRVSDAQLNEFARERVQTDITILPVDEADTPYLGWLVGDQVMVEGTAHRVLGLTVTEDADTGRAIYVPSLNDDVVLDPLERIFQAITKMIPGTLGGRSKVAQPVVPVYQPRALAIPNEVWVPIYATLEIPSSSSGWVEGPDLNPTNFTTFTIGGTQYYGQDAGSPFHYYVAFWEFDLTGLPSYFWNPVVYTTGDIHMRFTLAADDPDPDPPGTSISDFCRLRYEPGHAANLTAPANLSAWKTFTNTYYAPTFPGGFHGLYSSEEVIYIPQPAGSILEGSWVMTGFPDWWADFGPSSSMVIQATLSHNTGKNDTRALVGGSDPTLVITYPTNAV